MYNRKEIKKIFENCNSTQEVFKCCDLLKELVIEGSVSKKYAGFIGQVSIMRFRELEKI